MSSSWQRDRPNDALQSRQTRSSALAGGRGPVVDRPEVPKWLIEEQQHLLRNAGTNVPAPQVHTPAKRQSEKKLQRTPDLPLHDDLIMVDLLDGAHLTTRTSPQHTNLSTNSDSIISLPPIDDEVTNIRWRNIKAEAQERRRRNRGGISISGLPPSYVSRHRKSCPLPDSPVRRKPHVRIEEVLPPMEPLSVDMRPLSVDMRPLSVDMRPNNIVHTSPFVRADAIDTTQKASHNAMNQGVSTHPIRPERKDHETIPLVSNDAITWRSHSRHGSYSVRDSNSAYDDDLSLSASSHSNTRFWEKRQRGRRKQDRFQPGIWGWRKPAEEDAIMPSGALIYLPLIGILTFLTAYSVNNAADFISERFISSSGTAMTGAFGPQVGLTTTAVLRGLALVISFLLVLYIAPEYSMGSGIPEMKCVLSGVLMPRMLNWKTLVAKMSGLAFALSSSISIGRLGPFIHMSGIIAALVSKIPFFTSLHSSARFQLQALSAAMAAGVGATFGAPIGGTMLSIEIMSTYYYIHWLPMALYCSIMGYYCVVTIVQPHNHAFFSSSVTVDLELEPLQRLFTYVLLGAMCGLIGAALVQFTKHAFVFRSKRFSCSSPVRTAFMVFLFAIAHTVVSAWVGGVLVLRQKDGVIELINSNHENEMWLMDGWKPFSYGHWNSSVTLIFAAVLKFILTGISLVMPVPAGTFMPIFEIGALFGRAFGELCSGFSFVDWVDARATAIIGAAAVTAGALHTTSIAVVMLELTREAIDILPLSVGVIVAYVVSKQLCSDLFSELIKIRRLPFILGLRERYPSENKQFYEDVSLVVAASFMWKSFPYVTPHTTKGEILKLLTRRGRPWSCCALLSDHEGRRLWGTISQHALWDIFGDDAPGLSLDNLEDSYGTFNHESSRKGCDSETIPFLRDFNPSVGHPLVDMGPMLVSPSTPFWKIVTLFRMLSMAQTYVVEDGMTVGCITRTQVIHFSHSIEAEFKRKRMRLREREIKKQREDRELVDHLRRFPPSSKRLTSHPSAADLSGLAVSKSRSRQGSFSRHHV